MRLCPADPGNPRRYIEGESPHLWRGTYSLSGCEVGTTCLRLENFKVPPERHSFAVVMKEVRNLWRRRAVGSEKLLFLVLSG